MKAVIGAVELGIAAAAIAVMPAGAFGLTYLTQTTAGHILSGLIFTGAATEFGAIADMLKSGPGTTVSTHQSAASQRVIYGEDRVEPVYAWETTTGGSHGQLNRIALWAGHECYNVKNIFIDGKQVYFASSNWGNADGLDHRDYLNNTYNFHSGTFTYVEHRLGAPGQTLINRSGSVASDPHYVALSANDPRWPSTAVIFGSCHSYIKLSYDSALYVGPPTIKATIQGKANILDPRDGTRKYTNNAALVVADYLTSGRTGDTVLWGMKYSWDDIDTDELIASANVCDELTAIPGGGTEPRYTINGSFLTDQEPGSTLQTMLDAMAGRIVESGGKLKIIAGYDRGVTLSYDADDITGAVEWSSVQSAREIFTEVSGTFTCPNYPYEPVGNYVDKDHPQPGIFDGQWQPAEFPNYYLSASRGYAQYPLFDQQGNPVYQLDNSGQPTTTQQTADAYYAEDRERRVADMKLAFVTSNGQAQRLARIKLMRARMQGSGTIPLKLNGLRLAGADNVQVSFAPFGWINKELLVTEWRYVGGDVSNGEPLGTEIDVHETDPVAEYYWSASEALAQNSVAQYAGVSTDVDAPSGLVLESGADSAVITSDGIVHPRIRVTWNAPVAQVPYIAIQYSRDGGSTWLSGPLTTGDQTLQYIDGVLQGNSYMVRICGSLANGNRSSWLTAGPHIVSQYKSTITTAGINPNSPNNVADTSVVDSIVEAGAATIRVYDGTGGDGTPWTLYRGSSSELVPAAHITGLEFATQYYVVYDVTTQQTLALKAALATLSDNYYRLTPVPMTTCSADYTPPSSGGGGGTGSGGDPGGGGSYCFEIGTPIHTTLGVMPNDEFLHRWQSGEDIKLVGRYRSEAVRRAVMIDVIGWAEFTVDGESFRCSAATKLLSERLGYHVSTLLLNVGDKVETLNGYKPIERITRHPDERLTVLTVSMEGPSHEYLVGRGLRTHNWKLPVDDRMD